MKKIIYFLLSCDEQKTKEFLNKNSYQLLENKSLPKGLLRKSERAFKKIKKLEISHSSPVLTSWKDFCKNNSYQWVLLILLCEILKYRKEQVCWMLKIQPETLVYRLKQALLALEKSCSKEDEKNSKPIQYCRELAEFPLPSSIEELELSSKKPYIKICLLIAAVLLFLLGLGLAILFLSPSEVILYES